MRQRGSLTVWFTAEAVEAWAAEPRTTRGGQPWYSALAILTALTLRAVFRLAYRQTEGLIGSVIGLLGLALRVPDHTTLSRRAATLEVPRPRSGSGPMHLLVDSTGLKLCGAGEWLVEKHGTRTRRSWRKLVWGFLSSRAHCCEPPVRWRLGEVDLAVMGRTTIGGELAIWRDASRHKLVFGRLRGSPDHDAAMRIGGEAPGRRAHSAPRLAGHASARVTATSDRHRRLALEVRTSPEAFSRSFGRAGQLTPPAEGRGPPAWRRSSPGSTAR